MIQSTYNFCLFYSNELVKNLIYILIYTTNYLYFRYYLDNLGNILITSLFACDGKICAIELGLVTKKK